MNPLLLLLAMTLCASSVAYLRGVHCVVVYFRSVLARV